MSKEDILLRETVFSPLTTKGSEFLFSDLDANWIEIYNQFVSLSQSSQVAAYSNATVYNLGRYVMFSSQLWKMINATPQTNVTPGTDPLTWVAVYASDMVQEPSIDNDGIYGGSGTIPTNTVATLTDVLSFMGGFVGIGTATPTSKLNVKGGTPSTTKTLLIENSLLNPNLVVQDDGFVGIGIATPISTETVLVNGAISSTDSVNIYNGATNRIKLGNDGLIEFEGGQSLGYRFGLPFAINCYGAFWVHDNSIIINGNTPTDFISQRIGSVISPIASRSVGGDLTIGNDGTWIGNNFVSFGNVVLKSNDNFIYDVEVASPLRTLGLRRNISTKTDNYTAIATDHYLKLDASSNSILLELTSFGLGSVNYTGQEFIIKAIDVTNPITVIGFADQQSILDITNPSANTFRYTVQSGSFATVNVSDYIKFEQCLNVGNNGVFIVTATDSLTFVEITNISGVVELGSVGNYLINKFNKTLILNEVIKVIYDHISLTFDEF